MTSPPDILLEAARILMRDGWKQWDMGQSGGPRCQLGAIASAASRLGASDNVYIKASSLFERWLLANHGTMCTIAWNDAPERTAEDVILALRRAASEGVS